MMMTDVGSNVHQICTDPAGRQPRATNVGHSSSTIPHTRQCQPESVQSVPHPFQSKQVWHSRRLCNASASPPHVPQRAVRCDPPPIDRGRTFPPMCAWCVSTMNLLMRRHARPWDRQHLPGDQAGCLLRAPRVTLTSEEAAVLPATFRPARVRRPDLDSLCAPPCRPNGAPERLEPCF